MRCSSLHHRFRDVAIYNTIAFCERILLCQEGQSSCSQLENIVPNLLQVTANSDFQQDVVAWINFDDTVEVDTPDVSGFTRLTVD
jgi:hypothetical protein